MFIKSREAYTDSVSGLENAFYASCVSCAAFRRQRQSPEANISAPRFSLRFASRRRSRPCIGADGLCGDSNRPEEEQKEAVNTQE